MHWLLGLGQNLIDCVEEFHRDCAPLSFESPSPLVMAKVPTSRGRSIAGEWWTHELAGNQQLARNPDPNEVALLGPDLPLMLTSSGQNRSKVSVTPYGAGSAQIPNT